MFIRTLISILFIISSVTACSYKPHAIALNDISNGAATNTIYIVRHEWHTGIVLPTTTIYSQFPQLAHRFGEAPFLEFGWGDEAFYQAEEITLWLITQAILWPTNSVMHVVSVPTQVSHYFPKSDVIKLCLTDAEIKNLALFIHNSFLLGDTNYPKKLGKGLYGDSQFYQAEGKYFFLNTCNPWAAKGLKSAGYSITPFLKLSANSIINYANDNKC